jgi:hypothetical protein
VDTSYFDDYSAPKKGKGRLVTETTKFVDQLDVPRMAFIGFTYRHRENGVRSVSASPGPRADAG